MAATVAALLPMAASATSIGTPPKHQPSIACMAVEEWLADINSKTPWYQFKSTILYYGDQYGSVMGEAEQEGFIASLRTANGKPDRKPMTVKALQMIHDDPIRPLYVMVLERETWQLTRTDGQDGLMQDIIVDDPHYDTDRSYWLVSFLSNRLFSMREASELWSVATPDNYSCTGGPVRIENIVPEKPGSATK